MEIYNLYSIVTGTEELGSVIVPILQREEMKVWGVIKVAQLLGAELGFEPR